MPLSRELSQLASVITIKDTTRDVGINSSTPTAKLDVGGDVNISGVITATSFVGDGSNLTGITASADVVNDTTPQLGGNLDLNGNDITGTGGINVIGVVTATDFDSSSDINLKENIEIIKKPIEKIIQLNGITFDWKSDHRPSAGVIAQEVEKVLPEIVKENDGNKSVNYNGLIGLLVESVKEQQERIDALTKRIELLES